MKGILQSIFIYIICVFFLNFAEAQNLVPNPSFESFSSCPTGNSQIQLAVPWQRPSGSITSPDYCNSCYTQVGTACSNVGVPSNFGGSSNMAHTGEGYVGIFTHYTSCSNCREYVQVQLTSPLVAGQTYSVGFWALRADFSRYASDHLDLNISMSPLSQSSNQPITGIFPHVMSNVVTDKNNWTLVSGTFTASGGESWITIGNFNNTAGTTIQDNGSQGGSCALVTAGAYYFIDDVFVEDITFLDNDILMFEVDRFNIDQSIISWSFDNATANQFITIQYSEDGMSFEDIFTTEDMSVKSYIDEKNQTKKAYYRLKVIDVEGHVSYSDIKVVDFNNWSRQASISIYPNPNKGQFYINMKGQTVDDIRSLTLYNSLWQPVQHIKPKTLENIMCVTTQNLSSGIYFLQIDRLGVVHTQKVVIE